MILDDKKGALAAFREKISDESKIQDQNDLDVGDIVYVELDSNDGLILNKGYTTRLKFVVVAGLKSNKKEYGFLLVNSDNSYSTDLDWQEGQYPLRQSDYKEILNYDSWLDCPDIKIISLRKIKARKGEIRSKLTPADLQKVLCILRESTFIDTHTKKVLGII